MMNSIVMSLDAISGSSDNHAYTMRWNNNERKQENIWEQLTWCQWSIKRCRTVLALIHVYHRSKHLVDWKDNMHWASSIKLIWLQGTNEWSLVWKQRHNHQYDVISLFEIKSWRMFDWSMHSMKHAIVLLRSLPSSSFANYLIEECCLKLN
jgi:hypothetical protein